MDPSTITVYPSWSKSDPDVATTSPMSPVVLVHFTANVTRSVSLLGTVTSRLSAPDVHAAGSDETIRWCSPAGTPSIANDPVSLLLTLCGLAPSTDTPHTNRFSSPGAVEKLTTTVPGGGGAVSPHATRTTIVAAHTIRRPRRVRRAKDMGTP